jgi:hypothetical protein
MGVWVGGTVAVATGGSVAVGTLSGWEVGVGCRVTVGCVVGGTAVKVGEGNTNSGVGVPSSRQPVMNKIVNIHKLTTVLLISRHPLNRQ